MSMRSEWIDALFQRLTVRYGKLFTGIFDGVDIGAVKDDWAAVLGGLGPGALRYGLDNLAALPPKNALQFRDICLRAPPEPAPQIEGPKADVARVNAVLATLGKAWPEREETLAAACIRNIEQAAHRRPLTQAQRAALRACRLKVYGQGTT